jgi:hypothetical protein
MHARMHSLQNTCPQVVSTTGSVHSQRQMVHSRGLAALAAGLAAAAAVAAAAVATAADDGGAAAAAGDGAAAAAAAADDGAAAAAAADDGSAADAEEAGAAPSLGFFWRGATSTTSSSITSTISVAGTAGAPARLRRGDACPSSAVRSTTSTAAIGATNASPARTALLACWGCPPETTDTLAAEESAGRGTGSRPACAAGLAAAPSTLGTAGDPRDCTCTFNRRAFRNGLSTGRGASDMGCAGNCERLSQPRQITRRRAYTTSLANERMHDIASERMHERTKRT